LSDQTIADQTDLKGNATRTVGPVAVSKQRGNARSTSPTNAKKAESEPLFSTLAGPLASRGNQAPRSSELAVRAGQYLLRVR